MVGEAAESRDIDSTAVGVTPRPERWMVGGDDDGGGGDGGDDDDGGGGGGDGDVDLLV